MTGLDRAGARRRAGHAAIAVIAGIAGFLGATRGTQDAVANGDTRTISILHMHSKENLTVTFRRNGRYDSEALEKLNWLLRDWRLDEPTKMDPRLFDIVWEVQRSVGSVEPVNVVSAYRSPQTNAMLRRRSRRVAEFSQHMAGKAMDFFLSDVPMDKVRSIAMRMQQGGVGFYPSAYNPFVHLDAGSVRSWPRMTRDQLARLFPDGRTVHIPADGKPLAGYEEAKAEILARGGAVAGYAQYASEEAPTGGGKSLWATLFGGDDEDSEYYAAERPGRGRATSARAPVAAMAYAGSSNSDDGGVRGFLTAPEPVEARPARGRASRPAATQVASAQAPESFSLGGLLGPGEEPAPEKAAEAAAGDAPGEAASPMAIVPVPPRRPEEFGQLGALAFAPLPPSRPAELAGAGFMPLPSAVAPPTRVTAPPPPEPGPVDDRAQLRALFLAASTTAPSVPVKVAASRAKPQGEPPAGVVAGAGTGVVTGFTRTPPAEPGAVRFTGSVTRPVR